MALSKLRCTLRVSQLGLLNRHHILSTTTFWPEDYLPCTKSKFVTGSEVVIDGGFTAQ